MSSICACCVPYFNASAAAEIGSRLHDLALQQADDFMATVQCNLYRSVPLRRSADEQKPCQPQANTAPSHWRTHCCCTLMDVTACCGAELGDGMPREARAPLDL